MEIIAEIGQNHNGDMQLARRLIARASESCRQPIDGLYNSPQETERDSSESDVITRNGPEPNFGRR